MEDFAGNTSQGKNMDNLNLLKALIDTGCELTVHVPALGGGTTHVATPE